jgi:hypothetical protein
MLEGTRELGAVAASLLEKSVGMQQLNSLKLILGLMKDARHKLRRGNKLTGFVLRSAFVLSHHSALRHLCSRHVTHLQICEPIRGSESGDL